MHNSKENVEDKINSELSELEQNKQTERKRNSPTDHDDEMDNDGVYFRQGKVEILGWGSIVLGIKHSYCQ